MQGSIHFWLILLTASVSMIAPFSIDTYLPSFPSIEAEFAVTRDLLSTTLGAYLGAFSLTTLFWGPFADRFGRKAIALIALAGFGVASLWAALSPNFDQFLWARLMQGMMAGGAMIATRAMVRDFFPPTEAQKAMAIGMFLFGLGPAIAPILGGYLEVHFGWRSVFYFLLIYAITNLVFIFIKLPETQHPDHVQSIQPQHLLSSYWHSVSHTLFLRLVLSQAFMFGGFFIYITGAASLIYDHLHLGPEDFWIQFLPMVTGMMIGSAVAHRLSSRLHPLKIAWISLSLAGLGAISNLTSSLVFEPSIISIIPLLTLYSLGMAIGMPVMSILALDCLPEKRGMAASLQSLFQMGSGALVSALVVPFVHKSVTQMALGMLVLFFLGLVFWLSIYGKLGPLVENSHKTP